MTNPHPLAPRPRVDLPLIIFTERDPDDTRPVLRGLNAPCRTRAQVATIIRAKLARGAITLEEAQWRLDVLGQPLDPFADAAAEIVEETREQKAAGKTFARETIYERRSSAGPLGR